MEFLDLPPVPTEQAHLLKMSFQSCLHIFGMPSPFFSIDPNCAPSQCGPIGWASSHKPKGHWFDSLVRAQAWLAGLVPWSMYEKQPIDVSLSHFILSFSLPSPLSKIKNKIKCKKKTPKCASCYSNHPYPRFFLPESPSIHCSTWGNLNCPPFIPNHAVVQPGERPRDGGVYLRVLAAQPWSES